MTPRHPRLRPDPRGTSGALSVAAAALLLVLGGGCGRPEPPAPSPEDAGPRGATAAEHARRQAERRAHFDADRDGVLSPAEQAGALEAERRARRDPETVMAYEALREAHRVLLEVEAAGDPGALPEARAELEQARAAYRARRDQVLAMPRRPPGP